VRRQRRPRPGPQRHHPLFQNNNQANAHRDRRLLDTVEDGPLYAMSVSDYTETEGLPAAAREPYKPWSYDVASAKLYFPRLTVFAEQPPHERRQRCARLAPRPGSWTWRTSSSSG
jgi:hypothetical protein